MLMYQYYSYDMKTAPGISDAQYNYIYRCIEHIINTIVTVLHL